MRGGAIHLDPLPLVIAAVAIIAALVILAIAVPRMRTARRLSLQVRNLLGGHTSEPFDDVRATGSLGETARALEQWRRLWVERNAELDRAELLQSEILEALREGILAVDANNMIVRANDRLRDLFAISDAVIGKPLVQVLRHNSVLDAFDDALSGKPAQQTIIAEVPSGPRYLEMQVVPGLVGSEIAAVGLFLDVTRLHRLERVRHDFIADFSHEVRTPLAGLRTAFETLENSRLTPAQEEKLWKVISRQLRRLERLVEDLSELDHIESGDLVLQREPTELRRLLKELREDFSELISQRNVTIQIEGDETVAHVDPAKVQQVFSNLLENAIKFSRATGTVRVVVEDTPTEAVVRIVDQGEGIATEEHDRIFNRFYRVDKSRSQEVSGTGLGLAITKHLILRHGGTIKVASQPGRGATFEVRLPKGDARSFPRALSGA